MTEEYSATMSAFRLKEIHVTTNFAQPVELPFSFECQAEINVPNDANNPTIALEINFKTVGNEDKLAVTGIAQCVFTFDHAPALETRQNIVATKYLGEATSKIADSLGNILKNMGLGITIIPVRDR